VDGGFYDTDFPEIMMPLEPKDAEGNPVQWNDVERLIFERRSVRNFEDKPVPDTLIQRVLEAGRFAPSAGNNQPWKFTVITDKTLINQVEEACWAVWDNVHKSYTNDDAVVELVKSFGEPLQAGIFDPRVQGGVGCISHKDLPIFVNAPALILMGGNDKMVGPEMQVGICGQNMNLAAISLGLGFCWIGFSMAINFIPELKSKLGFDDPWRVQSAAVLGYPKFKQKGIVPRHYRPITWFRPGKEKADIED
jgi:nitroreductase